MTIRKYLTRRYCGTGIVMIAFILGIGLLQAHTPNTPELHAVYRLLGIAGLAFLVWNLYRTPCLNCRKPLGTSALWWIGGGLTARYSPRCPHCGVSIDSDLPGSAEPPIKDG